MWVVKAWVADRDITKYAKSEIAANRIAKQLKEAAETLSLGDVFKVIVTEEVSQQAAKERREWK